MIERIYLVTDLGPGDGGKGGVVHRLVSYARPGVILKCGGGQGSHGVCSDSGERFNFSHWGCGTLEGIPTFITERFTVIPHALLNEGDALRHLGFADPYAMLAVDPRALCATPFHGILSQLRELARKDRPRGTVGTGAGAALRMAERFGGEAAIRFADIYRRDALREKLERVSELTAAEAESLRSTEFLASDREAAQALFDLTEDRRGLLDWTMEQYAALSATSIRTASLSRVLTRTAGCAVVECSHGVLTDAEAGFRPHTSAIRTLPQFYEAMLREAGYTGPVVRLGVTRAYAVRHGAGPLPTASDDMFGGMPEGFSKEENRWQGKVRVGALDLILLRYAVSRCGGPSRFDGICVTWFDQIVGAGNWPICDRYEDFSGEYTAAALEKVRPVIQSIPVPSVDDRELLARFCARTLEDRLGIPVKMVSFGPFDRDKLLI